MRCCMVAAALLALMLHAPVCRGQAAASASQSGWISISDSVLKQLAADGKKIGYPGGTAGVCVDRTNGSIYMVVPDQGIWKSSDHGSTFTRTDGGAIGGRCETGSTLNADPMGGRIAGFMLDGSAAFIGRTDVPWHAIQQQGRGWDYGAVDWSKSDPKTLLAVHHETGCDLHVSQDAGATWSLIGKDYTSIGIFDSSIFVASRGNGVERTIDAGAHWQNVSDHTPTGRVLTVFHGKGYWVSKEGLLVSADKGATWKLQGAPIEAAWGPMFGKSERDIVVVGRVNGVPGFYRSENTGASWRLIAPFPAFEKESIPDWTPCKQWAAGWFCCFGWDPIANICYASRMSHPTLKYAVP